MFESVDWIMDLLFTSQRGLKGLVAAGVFGSIGWMSVRAGEAAERCAVRCSPLGAVGGPPARGAAPRFGGAGAGWAGRCDARPVGRGPGWAATPACGGGLQGCLRRSRGAILVRTRGSDSAAPRNGAPSGGGLAGGSPDEPEISTHTPDGRAPPEGVVSGVARGPAATRSRSGLVQSQVDPHTSRSRSQTPGLVGDHPARPLFLLLPPAGPPDPLPARGDAVEKGVQNDASGGSAQAARTFPVCPMTSSIPTTDRHRQPCARSRNGHVGSR